MKNKLDIIIGNKYIKLTLYRGYLNKYNVYHPYTNRLLTIRLFKYIFYKNFKKC